MFVINSQTYSKDKCEGIENEKAGQKGTKRILGRENIFAIH